MFMRLVQFDVALAGAGHELEAWRKDIGTAHRRTDGHGSHLLEHRTAERTK